MNRARRREAAWARNGTQGAGFRSAGSSDGLRARRTHALACMRPRRGFVRRTLGMESWVHRVGGEGCGTLPARMRQMGRRPSSVCPTRRLPRRGAFRGGRRRLQWNDGGVPWGGKGNACSIDYGAGACSDDATWDLGPSRRCSRVRIQPRDSVSCWNTGNRARTEAQRPLLCEDLRGACCKARQHGETNPPPGCDGSGW